METVEENEEKLNKGKEESEEKLKKSKGKGGNIRNLRVKRTNLLFTFRKRLDDETFKVSTKMKISTGKSLKSRQRKIGKSDIAPPENFSCYAPVS